MFSDAFSKAKSDKNKKDRGIDFVEARQIWQDPALRTVDAKMVDGETRHATIGFIGDKLWVAIWVNLLPTVHMESIPDAEPIIKIISVRRADAKFERIYYGKE